MQNVLDYIQFALSHANPKSVPIGAKLPFKVGENGVWEYLYGTRGQVCTQELLDKRFESYYSKNGWGIHEYESVTKGWVENHVRVTDCQGLLDAYLGNDVRANNCYNDYCTDKGEISAIDRPFVIGEAVFNGTEKKKTHVGWVCGFMPNGDVLIVEAKGTKYGVIITKMKNAWSFRGLMTKKFEYDEQPTPEPTPSHEYVFTRDLKKGCKGDDVIKLKYLLMDAGYSNGITVNTDSSKNFGSKTKKVVKEYQRDNGLTVDGIAGRKTITSLGGIFK